MAIKVYNCWDWSEIFHTDCEFMETIWVDYGDRSSGVYLDGWHDRLAVEEQAVVARIRMDKLPDPPTGWIACTVQAFGPTGRHTSDIATAASRDVAGFKRDVSKNVGTGHAYGFYGVSDYAIGFRRTFACDPDINWYGPE